MIPSTETLEPFQENSAFDLPHLPSGFRDHPLQLSFNLIGSSAERSHAMVTAQSAVACKPVERRQNLFL